MAFTPDGNTIVTGGHDKLIKLWTRTAKPRWPRPGLTGTPNSFPQFRFQKAIKQPDYVEGISLSPDGSTLVVATRNAGITVSDVASGRLLHTLGDAQHHFNVVAFHPRGTSLASGGNEQSVKLWDPATGKLLRTLIDNRGADIFSLAFNREGSLLAIGSENARVDVINVATGEIRHALEGHGTGVLSVAFNPTGSLLATGDRTGTVRIWDLAAKKLRYSLVGHTDKVQSLAFSPDGATLASGGLDASVRLWDPATGKLKRTLDTEGVQALATAFSPDGSLLAVTGAKGGNKMLIWETATYELQQSTPLTVGGHWAKSLAFSPDGNTIITGAWDKQIKIWTRDPEPRRPRPVPKLTETLNSFPRFRLQKEIRQPDYVRSIALSPDGSTLAVAAWEAGVTVCDLPSGRLLHTLDAGQGHLVAVAFHPKGSSLASASHVAKAVKLWDPATGKLLRTLIKKHNASPNCLAFNRDGSLLAVGDGAGQMLVIDSATGETLYTLKSPDTGYGSVAFNPAGSLLAGGEHSGTVKIWDLATKKPRYSLEGHTDRVPGLAFSPDGKTLASGSLDASVRLWDPTTGKLKRTLDAEGVKVFAMAFSPDGSLLSATGRHAQKTLLIWDTATYELQQSTQAHGASSPTGVVFTPDGNTIITGASDKLIKTWTRTTKPPKSRTP